MNIGKRIAEKARYQNIVKLDCDQRWLATLINHEVAPLIDASFNDVAANLAQMVIDWVEGGINIRTDWRNGLADLIALRLKRLQMSKPDQEAHNVSLGNEIPASIDFVANRKTGELENKIAAATAHRACCGSEHDPSNGKLHGLCVVCGVDWPCETAQAFIYVPQTSSPATQPVIAGETKSIADFGSDLPKKVSDNLYSSSSPQPQGQPLNEETDHDWSKGLGSPDNPQIGFVPTCNNCGISADDWDAANKPCPSAPSQFPTLTEGKEENL